MNCSHSGDGWCLECVKKQQGRIDKLEEAIDVVIEELGASGGGEQKVGGETLIEFLERTLAR
jgi:hypothetical protein